MLYRDTIFKFADDNGIFRHAITESEHTYKIIHIAPLIYDENRILYFEVILNITAEH